MTWFIEDKRTWSQKFFGNILQSGPLPKHVAIIMDGNRRFARHNNKKTIEGHMSGFDKLVEALNWCFTMKVKEVTVYAFSIENFKRSREEVDGLFDLAKEKFERLLNEKDKIDELQVSIRIFGDMKLLPTDLQKTIAKVVEISKHHSKLYMNVCIAYTSREEMTMAVKDICNGIKEKKLKISDIDEDLINNCLYTGDSNDVDLLVRTSGEVRLSDFLLWQTDFSVLSFVKKMWPEFSIWDFYMGILNFQLNYNAIQNMKHEVRNLKMEQGMYEETALKSIKNERTNSFLTELHNNRCKNIEQIAVAS